MTGFRLELIDSQLLADKRCPRAVGVQGVDHIVAIRPGMIAPHIVLVAVRVGKVDRIEPVTSPPLPIPRRSQQLVDQLQISGFARVGLKAGDLIGRGRQAGEIEVQSSNPLARSRDNHVREQLREQLDDRVCALGMVMVEEDCRVWLLKQKQTQDWKTTKATADAVYGLLLRGHDFLASDKLVEVIGRYKQRVAVACFASNVARVESLAKAALANGRRAALVGRSLWRMTEVAYACGYLRDLPPFLTEHDVGYLPRNEVLLICTGSQGEQGAAMTRIAANEHPHIVLDTGDVVLFSSRKIPGNEKPIYKTHNQLARRGVQIVTDRDEFIHVSGHPARDELKRMYGWIRPKLAVPMHGEMRHLIEHVAFAGLMGVPNAKLVTNGQALRVAPGPAEIVGGVPFGRLGLDGKRLIGLDDRILSARKRHRDEPPDKPPGQ